VRGAGPSAIQPRHHNPLDEAALEREEQDKHRGCMKSFLCPWNTRMASLMITGTDSGIRIRQ
jgi:hypothetical protein